MNFNEIYDQFSLEKDKEINFGRPFQRCSVSVMDTIADPNIYFDQNGICNYFHEYKQVEKERVFTGVEGESKLASDVRRIKVASQGKKYDCILGLSGGVDSTYLCYLAKELGLNPLVVHCDNGWNSELAQQNIESAINKCGFDLFTYVIQWEHFRELQLSYIKASVVDIEVLTDHAYKAVLYQQARKWKIRHVISGSNVVTEQVLPNHWIFSKLDTVNIKDIHSKHGGTHIKRLDSYPFINPLDYLYCRDVLKLEFISPLNCINYRYDEIKEFIKNTMDWRDYGGKHYESVWTRFYQGYILPKKFKIDKRKAHYSNLIFSGQMTREEALAKLNEPTYNSLTMMNEDLEYVLKKFGLSNKQFQKFMEAPRVEHEDFATYKSIGEKYPKLKKVKNYFKSHLK